jgi:hypothetical protein
MSQKSIQQSVEWLVVLVTGPKKWAKSEYNPRSNEAPPQSIDSTIAMPNIWLITGSSRGLGRVSYRSRPRGRTPSGRDCPAAGAIAGFEIVLPIIKLNSNGKDINLVGLGSYIVNAWL